MVRSWDCNGCTKKCLLLAPDGNVYEYCRVIYDLPKNRGVKWIGDKLACLDYTTKPEEYNGIVRLWYPPPYKRKNEASLL